MTRSILNTLAIATIGIFTATSASAAPEYPLFGDLNGDCIVDKADVYGVVGAMKGRSIYDADLNEDGAIDYYDYYLVYGSQNTTCGRRLMGDVNGDGVVNTGDVLDVLAGMGSTGINALDINNDQAVNQIDLDMVTAQLGATMARRVLGDVNGDYKVSAADIVEALPQVGGGLDAADADQDGSVDATDIAIIQSQMGETACSQLEGDANGDKQVDVYDLIVTYISIGSSLTQFDCDKDGDVDVNDYWTVNDAIGSIASDALEGDINGDWVVDDADVDLLDAVFGTSWTQADIDGSGAINATDLLSLNSAYGNASGEANDGDIDMNCGVDAQDLALLQATFGTSFAPADINGNGTVDTSDMLLLTGNYGQTCE